MSSPRAAPSRPDERDPGSEGSPSGPLSPGAGSPRAAEALPSSVDLPRAPTIAVDEPSGRLSKPTTAIARPAPASDPRSDLRIPAPPPEARLAVPRDPDALDDASEPLDIEPDPLLGAVVADRYRVQKLLGSGGMGRVYLAEHEALRKSVALKVVHPELARDGDLAARFSREALVAGALEHPHVAGAIDTGKMADGSSYIVMQYARGSLLREALDASGCFAWRRACVVAAQVADALEAAHAQRIIHRDLKPENLMLETRSDGTDHVRILDFGIARQNTDTLRPPSPGMGTLTRLGTGVGTPGYMPPEQAVGERIDVRADLYALGVILYELIAGHVPYSDGDLTRLLAKQLAGNAPRLSQAAADATLPPELDALVAKLIAPSKDDRPPSAGAVRDELRRIAGATLSGEFALGVGRTDASGGIRTSAVLRPPPDVTGATRIARPGLERALPFAPVAAVGCLAALGALLAVGIGVYAASDDEPAAGAIKPVPAGPSVPPAPLVVVSPPREEPRDRDRDRASKGRGKARGHDRRRDDEDGDERAPTAAPVPPPAPPVIVPSLEPPPAPTPPSGGVAGPPLAELPPELLADFTLMQTSARSSERDEAARRLLARGPETLPPVVRASAQLESTTSCNERKRWIRELATLGDPRALPQLRRLSRLPRRGCGFLGLGDCHDCFRASVARALRVLEPHSGE